MLRLYIHRRGHQDFYSGDTMMSLLGGFWRSLSVLHLLSSLRSLFATTRNGAVPLIIELLSLNACPAGVLLLLRLGIASTLATSGASFAIASARSSRPPAMLCGSIAAHAASSLWTGRCATLNTNSEMPLPLHLAAAQPPALLHLAGVSLCACEAAAARAWVPTHVPPLSTRPSPPPLAIDAFCLDVRQPVSNTSAASRPPPTPCAVA